MKDNYKILTLKIPERMDQELKEKASKLFTSKSAVVRQAIGYVLFVNDEKRATAEGK